jgi:hypothetical protein
LPHELRGLVRQRAPALLRDRIFALLGYEIVEGRLDGASIHEARRISYAPRAVVAER